MNSNYKLAKRYRIVYKMPFGGNETIEDGLESDKVAINHIIYHLPSDNFNRKCELQRYTVEEYYIVEDGE